MSGSEGKGGPKGIVLFVAGLAFLSFIGGSVAGYYTWSKINPDASVAASLNQLQDGETEVVTIKRFEKSLGRMIIPLTASGTEKLHSNTKLLLDAVIVFEEPFKGSAPDDPNGIFDGRAAMRDSFIEYLSQLSPEELQGSYGLMKLKGELLKRAKLVIPAGNPSSVLIQEFMIQK